MKQDNPIFEIHEWLTHKEAAEYLRLTDNAFRIMRSRNNIIVNEYCLGKRKLRFKKSELNLLMKASNNKRSSK